MDQLNEKKDNFLKALAKRRLETLDSSQKARISTPDRSMNLAKGSLDKDVLKASGGSMSAEVSEPIVKLKSGTDKIDTKQIQSITPTEEFVEKAKLRSLKGDLKSSFKAAAERGDKPMMDQLRQIASKMGSGAKSGLKAIPLVGAAAALMGSEDASAAIPGLDTADSAGMSAGAENQMLAEYDANKNYQNSQAKQDRMAALAKLAKMREQE